MAIATVEQDLGCAPCQVLLPRGAVDTLCGLLSDTDDPVRLSVQDSAASCVFNGTEVVSAVCDGASYYPDWRAVKEHTGRFSVDRRELHAALERVAVVLDARVPGVRWTPSGDHLTIDAMNANGETADETVGIEGFSGEDIVMGFHAGYLLDGIASAPGERIECAFDLKMQYLCISAPGFTYYLASMRV
jgi:DNA polymerase-3 subunit beta